MQGCAQSAKTGYETNEQTDNAAAALQDDLVAREALISAALRRKAAFAPW